MGKILSSKKNLIISIVVVVVLLVAAYWYFVGSAPAPTPILSSSAPATSDTLLTTLNQLKSLTLDSSVLSLPTFNSLKDNTVVLPTIASGRPNPFAPLPALTPTTTQTQIQGQNLISTH